MDEIKLFKSVLQTVGTGKQLRVPAKALSKNFFAIFFGIIFISPSDLAPLGQVGLQCKEKTEKNYKDNMENPAPNIFFSMFV